MVAAARVPSEATHKITRKKLGRPKSGSEGPGKLHPLKWSKLSKPGSYADGGGLYLHITTGGAKSWIFRYARKSICDVAPDGRVKGREMGLGPAMTVTLADARLKALECRKLVLQGIDPIKHRNATREELQRTQIQTVIDQQRLSTTFDMCVEQYIASHAAEWSSDKHLAQWKNTLATYVSPVIGNKPVADVNIDDIEQVFKLDKFWTTKTETATRVRQRIQAVLDWATVKKLREGDNPARWAGNLKELLAKPSAVKVVRPMPSLAYTRLPEFIAELRQQGGMAARALEFGILNASRPGEVVGATWSEIDLEARVWTISADRMKGPKGKRKEHRVPLGDRAIEILKEVEKSKHDEFVFPSSRKGKPMSDMTVGALIKRMNATRKSAQLAQWVDTKLQDAPIVPHGFRSTFSTYIAEKTEYTEDLREACLAHAVKSAVAGAYQRGDLFEKRRELLEDWASYCDGRKAA